MKDCNDYSRPVRCLQAMWRYLTRQYPHLPVRLPGDMPGNRVQLLVNGSENLPAMLAVIEGAKRSIRWQVMLYHPDIVSERLARALADAARRGVSVQLSFAIGQSVNGSLADRVTREEKQRDNHNMRLLLGLLRGAGVEVRENPAGIYFSFAAAGPRARDIQCAIARSVCIPDNHYDHRKLLVVDGCRALVGGMNVGRNYLYATAPDLNLSMPEETHQRQVLGQPEAWDKWLDVAMLVEGPIVSKIGAAFDWRWEVLGGTARSEPVCEPHPAHQAVPGSLAVQFLEQHPGHPEVSTRFFELVQGAQEEIMIASPFISFTPALDALRAAARHGVRVVLVTPGVFQEMPISGRIFADFLPGLLADGVEVWFNDRRMAHTKLLMVDRQVTLLGSFNLNFRSFLHDLEDAVVVDDKHLADEVLRRVFTPYLTISRRASNEPRLPGSLAHWIIRPFT
jgi:cardiolipin synthase A/B